MDKEIKEKIEQGRKILDVLERMAKGESIDFGGCKDKKCENCGGKHPTMEDVMEMVSGRKDNTSDRATPGEAKKIKQRLDAVLYREGGIAFIVSKADFEDGANSALLIRKTGVTDLLTNTMVFMRNAYQTALDKVGESRKEELQKSMRLAFEEIFKH